MKKLLLLVDDEPNVVMLTQARLQANGFEVIAGCDGREGLAKAKNEKPDAILLDISMPGIDGFETLAQLKNMKETRDIPVIMFTAMVLDADKERALEAGAAGYVVKPFKAEDLVKTIRTILESSAS